MYAGNEGTAAELFASAGDKYAAAAEKSNYEFKHEEHMWSTRLCYQLADRLEDQQEAAPATASPDTGGSSNTEVTEASDDSIDIDEGAIADMITEDVEVDFSDYVGREELKETLDRKVFSHAEDAELFVEFGVQPANGFVLYGPPGTGKTHFAKCMAGEVDMPFVVIDITELTSKYVNESAQLIGEVFKEIRDHAIKQGPTNRSTREGNLASD